MSYLISIILLAVIFIHGHLAYEAPTYLLNDGNEMPIIGLGTNVPFSQIPVVRQAIYWACQAGYRYFDTAPVYAVEPQVGQGLADAICDGIVRREDLFIVTKLWNNNHARERVIPALQRSLLRLGLDYIDLYLMHDPVAEDDQGNIIDIDYLEAWQGMEDARDMGLTRSIGVANFNASDLARLVNNSFTIPAVNEIEVNPTYTNMPLVSFCQSLNITVIGYSPLGFLVPRFNPDPPPPRFNNPTLLSIANTYNKSTSQVVLRYVVDRGAAVVVRSMDYSHIFSNININDFSLTQKEIDTISSFNINKKVYPLPINSQLVRQITTYLINPLNISFLFTDM